MNGAPQLKVFSISRNRAEDKGGKAIGLAVACMPQLIELHAFNDVIRNEGLTVILKCLLKCPLLEVLDIRDNHLREDSVVDMANLIKANKNLKDLNLADCNI